MSSIIIKHKVFMVMNTHRLFFLSLLTGIAQSFDVNAGDSRISQYIAEQNIAFNQQTSCNPGIFWSCCDRAQDCCRDHFDCGVPGKITFRDTTNQRLRALKKRIHTIVAQRWAIDRVPSVDQLDVDYVALRTQATKHSHVGRNMDKVATGCFIASCCCRYPIDICCCSSVVLYGCAYSYHQQARYESEAAQMLQEQVVTSRLFTRDQVQQEER